MKKFFSQPQVMKFLVNSFQQDKLSHAYIFLGPEGVGKAFTAKCFAQFLNCEKRSSFPCFECPSCIKIENNNHPDVNWIKQEEKTQGIKIDKIRELQEKISLRPYEGKFKIFIIEKADYLLEDAGNCLLKTLEEPPGDSILILLAEEKERFLPTIVSRCQIVRFFLLKREIIEKFLEENFSIDKEKIHIYSQISEGRIGKAISLVESDFLQRRDFFLEWIFKRRGFDDDFLGKEREEFTEALNFLSGIFRDVLLKKFGLDKLIINLDRQDLISEISLLYSPEELYNLIEKINFYYSLICHNVNLKLIFTNLEMDLDKKESLC